MNDPTQSSLARLSPTELKLFHELPDPAFVICAVTRMIVQANGAAERETGYGAQELSGMEFNQVISGALGAADARLIRKDGGAIPIELETMPGGGDQAQLFVGRFRRDAEQVRMDERDARQDADFREFLENASDLIYTHDLEGKLTYINAAGLKAFGLTAEVAIGRNIAAFVDKDFHALARANIRAKIESGLPTPPYDLLCRRFDGSEIWFEVSTRPILSDGKPVAIQGIGRDITVRKRAEAALHESERNLRDQQNILQSMLEQHPHAMAFWHPDGRNLMVNPAFVRLLGGTPPPGYNILEDPLVAEAGILPVVRRAFSGEAVALDRVHYDSGQLPNAGLPSHPACFSVTLFPIWSSDGEFIHVVSVYRDLQSDIDSETEHEKLEAQLRQAQKMEAIGTLAGGVAHDFNNLLTGVIGYLDLIRTMSEPKLHPYVDKAQNAARRGCDLTQQLLAYARKSQLEMRAHDLNKTVTEVAALVRHTMDRRIAIESRPQTAPSTVNADPGQMSQVLMNLCINARDALIEKFEMLPEPEREHWQPKITIETRLDQVEAEYVRAHSYARTGSFVLLSVSDNGVGMSAETKKRIFDPFFTTKPQGKGTGLGLATMFGIVKQHEGWVEVYSEPGQGTVFHVYLPATSASPVPLSDAGMLHGARGGQETILLVDDEEMIRELGKDILEGKGYSLKLARDGRDAIEVFSRFKDEIALVVLDLTMPELSGAEVLPKILELKTGVPVIISSGYSSDESTADLTERGAAAFVRKPYTSLELARVVRQVLDSRRAASTKS